MTHHLTKGSRSPTKRSHHAPPRPLPIVGADHPGLPLPMAAAEIERRLPFKPLTARHITTCHLCERNIQPGDTLFVSANLHITFDFDDPDLLYVSNFHTCWECGTGLMLFHGYYTHTDVSGIPPTGACPR